MILVIVRSPNKVNTQVLDGKSKVNTQILSGVIRSTDSEKYSGEYEVVPKAQEDVVLGTKQKLMTDNVTVKKIPYSETSNIYGKTVLIG